MIDIHAHILPGVDDGPKTMAESIALIQQAEKEGITDIIATSHAYNPQYHVPKETIIEQLALLRQEINDHNINVKLHQGQEIRIQDSTIDMLRTAEALSLADSKYVLIELPSSNIPAYTVQIIQGILSLDKVPIIAHPERNRAIAEKPERLMKLINHGAISQITAGSIVGHFGKSIQKLSLMLIDSNLVHTYGSDVHNAKTRPFLFDAGLTYLEKHKRLDAVDIFLENNARIVENIEVLILEPKALEKPKWWNLFA